MFHCGEQVLYGIHGVCEIINIEAKKISGKVTEYYVLQPIEQPGSIYYVPTQNQAAVAKMRPVLTQEELHDMLHSADVQEDAWIEDENLRKQHYISLISSGDRVALIRMVHTLHKHKAQQLAGGKRLHLCDENFLRDAQKLLDSEISLVMDIQYDDVKQYVKDILEK